MEKQVFEQLIEKIRAESLDTLAQKTGIYNQGGDKLHNFYDGADIMGGTAAQAAWGYMTKHLVALRDMINRNDFTNRADFAEKCNVQSITFASSGASAMRKTQSGSLRTHTWRESERLAHRSEGCLPAVHAGR